MLNVTVGEGARRPKEEAGRGRLPLGSLRRRELFSLALAGDSPHEAL